jgi:hypothetical protein
MQQLNVAGLPSSAVHFVLVGDSAYTYGGLLVGFANMPGTINSLEHGGVT